METAGYFDYLEGLVHQPQRDEVFVVDGVRENGRPFVTSVSTFESLSPRKVALGLKSGRVSRWVRDVDSPSFGHTPNAGQEHDWRLAERFPL